MNQQEAVETLKSKFSHSGRLWRILLDGKWGIGKTYCWHLLKESLNKAKTSHKFIYISLFGKDSIQDIVYEIKSKYLLTKYDQSKVVKLLVSSPTQIALDTISNKLLGKSLDFRAFVDLRFGKNFILCFDDVERKSENIGMKDILGLIEQVAEEANVLVLGNTAELKGKDKENFNEFKEKVIERSYTLGTLSDELVKGIIEKSFQDLQDETRVFIAQIFNSFGNQNLRILLRSLDFIREVSEIIRCDKLIVRICCSIITEDSKGNGVSRIKDYSPAFSDEDTDVFLEYELPRGWRDIELVREIAQYYLSNIIDEKIVENYLNPPKSTVIDEINQHLSDFIFYDEETIKSDIDKYIKLVSEQKQDAFQSIQQAIQAFHGILNASEFLGYEVDIEQLKSRNLKIIAKKYDEYDPSRHSLNAMEFPRDLPEPVAFLYRKANEITEKTKLEERRDQLQQYLRNGEYYEAQEIVFQDTNLVFEMELLNALRESVCCSAYYGFILRIVDGVGDAEVLGKMVEILESFKDEITDKLVSRRIQILIDRLNKRLPNQKVSS